MNLAEYFDELNRSLFDGKLDPIEIRWRDTRSRGGLFVCRITSEIVNGKRVYRKYPQYIEVSSYFCRTEDATRGVLAHEMIHYYLAKFNIRDNAVHGTEFHKMLRRLNAKGVVHIPFMVEDPDQL